MIVLQGKYATAKVFTDVVESRAISQVITLLNQPYMENSRIRMMPDITAGIGCTVGTTLTIGDKICPNLVGGDIGCGMETIRIREDHLDLEKLDAFIRSDIPFGFKIRKYNHPRAKSIDLSDLHCGKWIRTDQTYKSLGTLGGGNHFIEVDRDDDGRLYIVIHSGSRRLGLEVAKFYQKAAYKALTGYSKEELDAKAAELKSQGCKNIETTLKNLKPKYSPIPDDLAYVEGELFDRYLDDMKLAQRFAELNRQVMMEAIVKAMGIHVEEQFTTVHNYIDIKHMILRKGAVSAQAGERLLIPINMRDGSLICTGKGNEDWNFSAPHGAGRLMSRGEAKQTLTMEEYKQEMAGIFTTSVSRSTLDESPMAYKKMADIVDNVHPTVTIDAVIRPIYNFKAGMEDDAPPDSDN